MKKLNSLTEGAVLLALFTVLVLLTMYLPILGTFTMIALPLPFILYTIRQGWSMALSLLGAAVLITLIVGTIFSIPLTLIFAISGIIMGVYYKQQRSGAALVGGAFAYLASIVIMYIVSILFFQINPIDEALAIFEESIDLSSSLLSSMGQTGNEELLAMMKEQLKLIGYLTPSIFVSISFLLALLTHLVSRPIVNRLGHPTPSLKSFRDWQLPQSIVWYYLIVTFVMFFNLEVGSYLYIAVVNLSYILMILLTIQGFSFIFYYCHEKKLSKAFPIIAIVLSFVLPIMLYIVRILGIIDLGFNLKAKISKK